MKAQSSSDWTAPFLAPPSVDRPAEEDDVVSDIGEENMRRLRHPFAVESTERPVPTGDGDSPS